MARTYDYLPNDPADLFRSITATVNDNLTTDSDLSASIPRVKFKAETITELIERLTADGEAEPYKSERYPIIALVRRYEQGIKADSPYIDASFDIVIATLTDRTYRSETRKTETYDAILWPIYTEFMEQVALSPYFQGAYNPYPEHNVYESFNFGQRSPDGNKGFTFPDCVDAIVITGLKLKLNRPRIAGFTYGESKQLLYLNNVSKLSCVASGNQLTVTFDQKQYIDSLSVGHPTYTLTYYPQGEPETVSIAQGGSYTIQTELDGEFYGFIQCDDSVTVSKLYFYYQVSHGVISRYLILNEFKIQSFQLTGFDYPDYPFNVVRNAKFSKPIIQTVSITGDGGNVLDETFYSPSVANTDETTTEISMDAPDYYRDVVSIIQYEQGTSANTLESSSYYKLS